MLIARRHADVIWDVVDDALTLCHVGVGEFYCLNHTGRIVWEACDGRSPEALATVLHEAYPAQSRDEVERHVRALLESLEAADLVELVEPAEVCSPSL